MTTVHIDFRDPLSGTAPAVTLTFTPTRRLAGVGLVPTKRVTLVNGQADIELLATDDVAYGAEPWAYRVGEYIGGADGVYRYVRVPTSAHVEYDDLVEMAAPGGPTLPGGGGSGEEELPAGGTTGQVLVKASNLDGDVKWDTLASVSGVVSVNGNTGVVTITKSDLGLSNVDNTSDANKPISTLVAAALASKADVGSVTKSSLGLGNVDNTSDANKPISTAMAAALALKADASAVTTALAGKVNVGSITKASLGLGNVDNTSDADKPVSVAVSTALANKVTIGTLTKSDVGLSNVDNTSDANKPISTATASALAGKAAATHTHAESDITGLSTDLSQRPVAYSWNGSAYVASSGARIYVGSTDPGSVPDGSIWYNTSP